jgi:hypothetical protein
MYISKIYVDQIAFAQSLAESVTAQRKAAASSPRTRRRRTASTGDRPLGQLFHPLDLLAQLLRHR